MRFELLNNYTGPHRCAQKKHVCGRRATARLGAMFLYGIHMLFGKIVVYTGAIGSVGVSANFTRHTLHSHFRQRFATMNKFVGLAKAAVIFACIAALVYESGVVQNVACFGALDGECCAKQMGSTAFTSRSTSHVFYTASPAMLTDTGVVLAATPPSQ